MAPTVLTPPPGWDLTGDPNNPAYRSSPATIVPGVPNDIGTSVGINVAANTGITGVYYRDIAGDHLIGTLSSDGKTFNLSTKGRSYLYNTYGSLPPDTFTTNAKAQSWLNSNLLPIVNNQRGTFLTALYKNYTGNYNSNLSSVPGFNGNAPQSGNSQTQVQPPPTGGGGILDLQANVSGISTQFGKIEFKKGQTFQYPKDAIYTGKNAQDHLTIIKYRYKPPYGDDIFKKNQSDTILNNGLTRGSALKELLGTVIIPMPNNVSDSNNVAWAEDTMNNLTAAATNSVASNLGGTAAAGIVGAAIGGLLQLFTGAGSAGGGASAGVSTKVYFDLMNAIINKGGANAQTIGGAAGASRLLSMAGFQVSPESILARGGGFIPNSNLELLFNAPTIREFQFQYRMSPRGDDEAKIVNNIIRFFKQGMSPKKQNGKAGAASYFLGTPDIFQLSYKTSNDSPIKGVNRIKTCALTGFSMNYAADGNWAAYDNGQPVSVIMNMAFKELEPVYDTDYQNSDNIESGRNDLYPITDEDVGY